MTEGNCLVLLNQLEDILDSDPLIDEVGFIHPSQFVTLNEEAGGPLLSSVGTTHQSKDGVLGSRVSKVNSSEMVFWCRDHKLGISTQVLLPLYGAAKHAFMAALERYKTHSNISVNKDASGRNMPICLSSSLDILESDVMKHSRALLLLSCDFGTAWNARGFQASKAISNSPHYPQVLSELNKSRDWAQLHIADSSCFHYRTRLLLRLLEESWLKQNPSASSGYNVDLCQVWKEELDWNEILIKLYMGREALWLHRRFLSLGWIKNFAADICDVSRQSDYKNTMNHEIGIFMDNEVELFYSCSTIPHNDFEDFQAHASFSATYILWLMKQISVSLGIEVEGKLAVQELKAVINKVCPEKIELFP
ncbi:hypothetical protein U1Q18_016548 [Sarracenia purpurea var. burkii]